MRRVVLDTNVTISALFWSGHPRTIYNLVRDRKLTMLISKDIENEFIKTSSKISVITADPTDNIFLECAADGRADYIISGDKHLLDLGTYSGIPILKAKDFLVKEGYLPED